MKFYSTLNILSNFTIYIYYFALFSIIFSSLLLYHQIGFQKAEFETENGPWTLGLISVLHNGSGKWATTSETGKTKGRKENGGNASNAG